MKREASQILQKGWISVRICLVLTILTLSAAGTHTYQRPDGYAPPADSTVRLGSIDTDRATAISNSLAGAKKILRLPGGQLYVDADMDIDADGSPRARQIDPCCGQLQTSLTYSGATGQARFVNSEDVPYLVLPGRFFQQFGIQLGDVAAVIFKDKVEYAVFADTGPRNKIGEGSIKLAQSLGHDPFVTRRNGTRVIGRSIPKDVIYIVFPGSKNTGITPQNIVERTREKARALFTGIGGSDE